MKSKTKKTAAASRHTRKAVKIKKTSKTKKSKTIASARRMIASIRFGEISRSVRAKRVLYMFLSVVTGLLIGTIVALFMELIYLKKMLTTGVMYPAGSFMIMDSFLPMPFEVIFLLGGLFLGIWLGVWGWNAVYGKCRK